MLGWELTKETSLKTVALSFWARLLKRETNARTGYIIIAEACVKHISLLLVDEAPSSLGSIFLDFSYGGMFRFGERAQGPDPDRPPDDA